MNNFFTLKGLNGQFIYFSTAAHSVLTKPFAAIILVLFATGVYGQAPSLKYSNTLQTFSTGRAITPLKPTASRVAAYSYNSTPQIDGAHLASVYGMALDEPNNTLYVADGLRSQVKKINLTTGHATIVGTGFKTPYAVGFDSAGNVYVADYGNNAVKEVLAGTGATVTLGAGFKNPAGLVVDPMGNIFVADAGNNEVKEIRATDHAIILIGTGFKGPTALALDSAGNIYVADTGNNFIKEVPAGGGTAKVLCSAIAPTGVAADDFGDAYIMASSGISELTPGNVEADPLESLDVAGGTIIYSKGQFFVGYRTMTTIGTSDFSTGSVRTVINGSLGAKPISIAMDHSDNAFVLAGSIFGIAAGNENPVTAATGFFSGSGNTTVTPSIIAVDQFQTVYFGAGGYPNIFSFSPYPSELGFVIEGFAQLGSGLNQVSGIAADNKRNIFVTETGNNDIKMFRSGKGAVTTVATGFNAPGALTLDSAGNIYVADTHNNAIKKVQAGSSTATTVATGLNLPNGVVVDNIGNLFVSDGGTASIKEILAGTSSLVTVASGFVSPVGLAINNEGHVYVADAGDSTVKIVTPQGGYYISPALPKGLSIDQNTGIISGTPTAHSLPAFYTVTAYNASGSASANVLIGVTSAADLAAIKVSSDKLTPFFRPITYSYADTVASTIPAITVTPTAQNANATITVNGIAVPSGSASPAILLAEGTTTITILVTAPDDISTKTYTIKVFKPFSSNANLSEMHPNAGAMSPVFTPSTTGYSDAVTFNNNSIRITPKTQDTLATITVNGVAVASGSLSQVIPLTEGSNTITTVVTAPDGVTTKTYTLTVTRPFSNNANLSEMHPNVGKMNQPFTPLTTSYTDNAGSANTSVRITVAAQDSLATITVDGTVVASGSASPVIALAVGSNVITTVVTAPDGVTTKTYTLTVTRQAVPPGPLNAAFQPEGFEITTNKPLLADDGLLVHRGLSPNGDGVNDVLTIENIDQYPDNKLSIMNRNGQLIFEAKGYDNTSKVFDGHSNKNGQMQLPGTYFYQLDYTTKGITKHKTGFIVLKY